MTIYDEYSRESPMQETLPTPGSTVPGTTVQPPASHVPKEVEIVAIHEACWKVKHCPQVVQIDP